MSRRFVIGLVAAVACAAFARPSVAQDDRFATLLAEANAELAREKTRIASERNALESALKALVLRRNALSDQRVDLELALVKQRASADLAALRKTRGELHTSLQRLEADIAGAARIRAEVAGRLADFVDAMPGEEARSPVAADAPIRALLAAMRDLLERGRTVALARTSVIAPDGTSMPADVLRIGHVARAYRTDDGRIAVAMNSPGGDASSRWVEALDPEERSSVAAAFDAAKSGGEALVAFPIDPTQQLRAEATTRRQTWIDVVQAGGPVMIPLAAVALLALLLILLRVFYFAVEGRGSARIAEQAIRLAEAGAHPDAVAACKRARGPTARALAACLESRDHGVEAREDAIQEQVLHELPRVERFLSTIGILAAIAPLLGLLGTVTGMILTFEMIATFGSGDPRMMAGGISQALITTAAGLIIAIPILLAHAFLSARADRLIADTERYSATMLNVLRERS